MKHAGDEALDKLENLLVEIRKHPALKEKKRGIFYRKSAAFLHFHEDPTGLFADVRDGASFRRFAVTTPHHQKVFLAEVTKLASRM